MSPRCWLRPQPSLNDKMDEHTFIYRSVLKDLHLLVDRQVCIARQAEDGVRNFLLYDCYVEEPYLEQSR